MSREILELMAQYKINSHLIKVYQIRMETPEMPLYDKNEYELQGVTLQDARKTAKEAYPIAPQLDWCRLLVDQDALPTSGTDESPIETVITQICVLGIGLLHGGQIACLTDLYQEVDRFSNESGCAVSFNWSPCRLFSSIPLSRHFLPIRYSLSCSRSCFFFLPHG